MAHDTTGGPVGGGAGGELAPAVSAPGDPGSTGPSAGDPFPRERFVALVGRLPRYLRLAWGLAGEPRLSRARKAGVLAAAGYLASPVDLVPGIIPVVGQLDDIAVALLALRAALRALDPAVRDARLAAVGLAPGDLEADLTTLGATSLWLARRGVAVSRRLLVLGGRVALQAAVTTGDVARRVVPPTARAGGRLARAAGRTAARAGGAAARAGRSAARAGGSTIRAGESAVRSGGSAVRATAGAVAGRSRESPVDDSGETAGEPPGDPAPGMPSREIEPGAAPG